MKICFYLSDHGYGHMARNIPIMECLAKQENIEIVAVCNKGQVEFAKQNLSHVASINISFRVMPTDVGLILQKGTLLIDKDALEQACKKYLSDLPQKARQEAKWLVENNIDKVVCDMPLWAIEACKIANIPLLFSSNFTWAEQYREHLSAEIYNGYVNEYKKVKHAVYIALSNDDMKEYLPKGYEVSIFSRDFDRKRAEEIKAQHKNPIIFVALGMSASFENIIDVSDMPYDIITTPGVPMKGDNVTTLSFDVPDTHNFILASDYVITKSGWGTVAEALLARRRMALFARDTVFEDKNTIDILKQQELAISVEFEDLFNLNQMVERMNLLSDENFKLYTDDAEKLTKIILTF